jgi:peptidyl-prolyl cis-trans isomerase B (cyclophilin B)
MSSSKRQRQLARERQARQAARRAERERRRRRRLQIVAGATAVLLVGGAVGFAVLAARDEGSADTVEATDEPPDEAAEVVPDEDRPVACGAEVPEPPAPQSYEAEPPLELEPGADYVMTLRTSCGEIVVDLLEEQAPRTVNSFRFLAGADFFDGAPFSRLTAPEDGFVVLQGGDQEGTGTGGPGYTLPDENLEGAVYRRGTTAMANAGTPDSGGSQFFLIGADTDGLTPTYTPFGEVESGLEVLDEILAVGSDGTNPAGGGRPSERVFIEDLTVSTR